MESTPRPEKNNNTEIYIEIEMQIAEFDPCVLCLEDKKSPVALECGHSFCKECLNELKTYRHQRWAKKCPLCRSALTERKRSLCVSCLFVLLVPMAFVVPILVVSNFIYFADNFL
uniref:RING-type domain-containing protein n=1 Tax=Stomoxys calcitrans TaxID=35570 RepID=A0A1I8PEJ3_STOCA